MASSYSPKAFMRESPNLLLERYFHGRGLLTSLKISDLRETEIQSVYEGYEALPAGLRADIDGDFQLIESLADDDGLQALLEEARFHGEDLEPIFTDMDGFYDKVFFAFLRDPRWVDIAARFREADKFPANYWQKRKDVPKVEPRDDTAACDSLAEEIGRYYRENEGRGYSCKVEVYKRADAYYYFAYPEDYGRTQIDYDHGELARRAHRPAFEIVFVYSCPDGTLDTFLRGSKETVRDLQGIFGDVVLNSELGDPEKDEKVYDLNVFRRRDRSTSVFLARGMAWRDAETLGRHASLKRRSPLLLAIYDLPDAGLFPGSSVYSLSGLLRFDHVGISLNRGHLERLARSTSVAEIAPNVFRLEGDVWTLRYQGGRTVRLRHTRGLGLIAVLLASSGKEIAPLDLARRAKEPDSLSLVSRNRRHAEAAQAGLRVSTGGDLGPVLDTKALEEYRQRRREIEAELREAEANNDVERISQLQVESEWLRQQVSAAVGLGGRDRKAGALLDRARVNVTKQIKQAIKKVEEAEPELGAFLRHYIKTGTVCSYVSDLTFSF